MISRAHSLFVAALLVVAPAAHAQEKSPVLDGTLRAYAVLTESLRAVGGAETLSKIGVVARVLAGVRTDVGQGLSPVPAGEKPRVVNRPRLTTYLDVQGRRFVSVLHDTILGGQPVARWTALTPVAGFFANGVSKTAAPSNPQSFAQQFGGAARRYPEAVLLSALNRRAGLRWLGSFQYGGRTQKVITFADADGAQVTLYFDAASKLLTKAEVIGGQPLLGDYALEFVFDDWRDVGGVKLPFTYQERTSGVLLQDLRASSIQLVASIPDSLTTKPAWPAAPIASGSDTKQLAANVYVLTGSYNSLLVGFDTFSVIVEAGNSPDYTAAQLAQARKLLPDKPVRYVVVTHFHYDHVGGIRTYIAEGIRIIAPQDAVSTIKRAAGAHQTLYPDALAKTPRQPIVQPLHKRQVITGGGVTLELHDIGPNPHANHMIVAYVPGPGILYEADMLDLTMGEGASSVPGKDTAALLQSIRVLGLKVETIVPTHGRVGVFKDLTDALGAK